MERTNRQNVVLCRPSRRGVSRNRDGYGFCVGRFRRPSRRGVSRNNITVEGDVNDGVSPLPQGRRNGVLAEKFHILTSTGALNLQLFDCKYEDVRKAAVLQTLEAIFSKH